MYDRHQNQHLADVYGFQKDSTPNVQVVGHVQAATGRCVVFPNFMRYCVAPYELAGPTKPGHRKIICSFLVHPEYTVFAVNIVLTGRFMVVKYVGHDTKGRNMSGWDLKSQSVDALGAVQFRRLCPGRLSRGERHC
ncbi:Aste57867_18659 [Aphanomyces stellatus]|uniref:Aste57867_18659 protein n=1 Tax=Aphanomyces stellatus TaxID=120398 RepID=A0A485LAP4_9STRA|nr:hypothetical protein As57867_018597 [Aphanomyces stellatus]VFT95394.1 Aste57867_18659 [Aphanomyces stellatus]